MRIIAGRRAASTGKTDIKALVRNRYADVAGVETHFMEAGDPNGKPLVLVHGFLSNADSWSKNIIPLSEIRRVIAPDLPGFGRSGNPRAWPTQEYFISFLGDFMRVLSIDRADLIGHSMGGGIVIAQTLAHPETARSIVAEDPYGICKLAPVLEHIIKSFPFVLAGRLEGGWHALARGDFSGILSSLKEDITIDCRSGPTSIRWLASEIKLGFKGGFPSLGFKTDYTPLLHTLRDKGIRAMFTSGNRDPLFPEKSIREAAVIAGASFAVISHSGHDPQEENSKMFNRTVTDFLENKRD
ncbi:MAG: alpha/beta hydrolase [Candidatus Marsarchaeota archaeon]|nr:alpha/beta hydrolase [Candidatus Marsarchaeota archaeon]